ncbi:uncharacterized protein EI97DRAFT_444728 [Westerdykella ornata]|uniref:Uncharacterized protein n=1 Tax=Westerdykella ornata TaxID=318751 RepID=A0A6A6JAQ0_WESOR|nr:uncharacterized protein EI97DRAFT_444728 [Westerdykella ornata]KAF2273671.1 hypothetical protein EI97DRAFT_444728 [Westerdykella ornata]
MDNHQAADDASTKANHTLSEMELEAAVILVELSSSTGISVRFEDELEAAEGLVELQMGIPQEVFSLNEFVPTTFNPTADENASTETETKDQKYPSQDISANDAAVLHFLERLEGDENNQIASGLLAAYGLTAVSTAFLMVTTIEPNLVQQGEIITKMATLLKEVEDVYTSVLNSEMPLVLLAVLRKKCLKVYSGRYRRLLLFVLITRCNFTNRTYTATGLEHEGLRIYPMQMP